MLSISTYTPAYIERVRAGLADQLAAYRAVKTAAQGASAAVAQFEPAFAANLILALDARFGHRARGQEGKDGNPLNEVRMLCGSLMAGEGVLLADKTIRYRPEASVLGLKIGDPIALTSEDAGRLAVAFLDGVAQRYT